MKIVVIGGGWSGIAAALQAKKCGAKVTLIEKTDMLLGLGNVGGIMRNNGRFTAAEEMIELGAGELFEITDRYSRHVNIDFPGHKHASVYDVIKVEPTVRKFLVEKEIEILLQARVVNIEMDHNTINGIYLSDGTYIQGDVFIETTGTTGPMGNCLKYGNGCSMCILRCPSFGPRISISRLAGAKDLQGMNNYLEENYGAMSGSCKLSRESLSKELLDILDKDGVAILEVPKADINMEKLKSKVCQQYALKEFAENIVLIDTGYVKLMTSYYPLDKLRKIAGLEYARFEDPYAGGKTNSIRYLSMAPRDNSLKVDGVQNLLCAGEKAGLFVGHTEAICTGALAGMNSVRLGMGLKEVVLPVSLAIGDLIDYENMMKTTEEGLKNRYTFAGAGYFNRMKELGLYTTNKKDIKNRVALLSLNGLYRQKII
jgi:hypothetical protein